MNKTNATGQLQPLVSRLSANQAERRTQKQLRRTAQALAQDLGYMRAGLASFFNRGLLGRLKWLLRGK